MKLNLKNPEVEKFVTDVACYWIKECDIDGWRMDVGDEISHFFWKRFRKAVKAVKKDLLIIGEIWHYAGDFLEGDEWDTVMNYPFYLNLIDLLADEKIQVSQFIQNLGYLKGRLNKKCYPLMWNLIDSHDTARFLHLCNNDKKKQHLAAAFQLLLPGMPMVYYGDEAAMPGANDPDCRRGMYWDEEYQDKEMFEWYKRLLQVRKAHTCIVEGELAEAISRDEDETFVLIRKNGEETFALINREAAQETARQIRLRNLSGIILIDFINQKDRQAAKELLEELRSLCKEDPVPVRVVDITALGLVELTRKKVKGTLAEQLKGLKPTGVQR